MAKRRVGSQIGSLIPDQKKSGIDLIYLFEDNMQHTLGKLDKGYNFASNRISIRGLLAKLWGSKIVRVPAGAILGLPLEDPGREKPFRCGPHGEV